MASKLVFTIQIVKASEHPSTSWMLDLQPRSSQFLQHCQQPGGMVLAQSKLKGRNIRKGLAWTNLSNPRISTLSRGLIFLLY